MRAAILLVTLPALLFAAGLPRTILAPARPSPPEAFAAGELQLYLERMTGVRLAIVTSAGGPFLSVGDTTAARTAGAVPKPRFAEDDTYTIRSDGGNIYLVGANPRATLYAVYEFLERAGCRWFAPGYRFYRNFHESVPRRQISAWETGLSLTAQPAFQFRGEYPEHYYAFDPDDVIALLDWCTKNRINLVGFRQNEFSDTWYRILSEEAGKRGLLIASSGHGYDRFLPRDRYFRQHPDWYAALDGARRSDRYFDQFCTSNPEALAEFRRNLADFVRRHPALHHISAMPNDSPRWCTCARCQAEGLSSRDRLFRMTELISKTVFEANPKMKVEMGVGVEYFGVAASEFMTSPHSNLTYRSGVLRRCLRHAWNDPACETNRPQYEIAADITRRILARGSEVVWASRWGAFREQSLPGILYPHQMQTELADLKKLGASGVLYNYATVPDWIPYELKQYLYARLAWDPGTRLDAFLEAYYRERFPGSPEETKAFHEALRRAMERYDHPGGGYTREDAFGFYPPDQFGNAERDMAEAGRQMSGALARNENPDEKQLLWLLNASFQYARQRLEIDRLAQAGQREEARAKTAALIDFIEKWSDRGIFYDNSFLRRIEYRFTGPPKHEIMKKRPWSWVRMYEYMEFEPDQARRPPRKP